MICYLILFLLLVFGTRLMYILHTIHKGQKKATLRRHPLKVAIVIGSGGHTAEVIRILKNLNPNHYSPRLYIMASSDSSSEVRIHKLEETFIPLSEKDFSYEIMKIPRSRNVGQSYFTSVFTTLVALLATFPLMIKKRPELIICNGPGTCIPVCAVAFLIRVLGITNTKIVFVESICRVKTLSLSGKILLIFADEVLVQWPKLQSYKRTKYIGRLS